MAESIEPRGARRWNNELQRMFEDLPDEWQEWIALTPLERWRQSQQLFAQYLAQGGSLDPDPDPDSPSTFRKNGVQTLLMGGQACVFYGAAQVSKDIDQRL